MERDVLGMDSHVLRLDIRLLGGDHLRRPHQPRDGIRGREKVHTDVGTHVFHPRVRVTLVDDIRAQGFFHVDRGANQRRSVRHHVRHLVVRRGTGDEVEGADTPAKKATVKALDEFLKEARPGVSPKTFDEYINEFGEATGLDVSGEPDTKQALMSFGLALMQNRAGKGFNISNILILLPSKQ